VDLNTSNGGGSVEKHDILAPGLLLRPVLTINFAAAAADNNDDDDAAADDFDDDDDATARFRCTVFDAVVQDTSAASLLNHWDIRHCQLCRDCLFCMQFCTLKTVVFQLIMPAVCNGRSFVPANYEPSAFSLLPEHLIHRVDFLLLRPI
jgi:hypothetical protein